MKKILIILLLVISLCGCAKNETKQHPSEELKTIMREKEHIILDVRTKEEYEENHIIKSKNIPYDQIDENLKKDKNIIIFVYCRSGSRSKIAKDKLEEMGYTVYDLGGLSNIDLPKEGDKK